MQNYFGSRRDFIDLDDWVNFHDSLLLRSIKTIQTFIPFMKLWLNGWILPRSPPLPNKVFILFHQKVIKIQWAIQKNFLWSSPISKTSATDIVIVMQISVRTSRLSWCYLLSSPITGNTPFWIWINLFVYNDNQYCVRFWNKYRTEWLMGIFGKF